MGVVEGGKGRGVLPSLAPLPSPLRWGGHFAQLAMQRCRPGVSLSRGVVCVFMDAFGFPVGTVWWANDPRQGFWQVPRTGVQGYTDTGKVPLRYAAGARGAEMQWQMGQEDVGHPSSSPGLFSSDCCGTNFQITALQARAHRCRGQCKFPRAGILIQRHSSGTAWGKEIPPCCAGGRPAELPAWTPWTCWT